MSQLIISYTFRNFRANEVEQISPYPFWSPLSMINPMNPREKDIIGSPKGKPSLRLPSSLLFHLTPVSVCNLGCKSFPLGAGGTVLPCIGHMGWKATSCGQVHAGYVPIPPRASCPDIFLWGDFISHGIHHILDQW